MAYLRTDDHVRIYYEEHGPIEPKATGSPLVLAYGIGGNADLWDVNVPALAARHRLVLWEPRGHARSDSPEDPARSRAGRGISRPCWTPCASRGRTSAGLPSAAASPPASPRPFP